MKKQLLKTARILTINTLATTALTVLLMCFTAIIQNYTLWGVFVPFEMLLVNFLMHIGFFFIDKIEIKYRILNYALMFAFLTGIIIGFGFLFDWFHASAIWIVCIVGATVFLLAIVIDIVKIRWDAAEINEKLKKIQEKNSA